MAEVSNDAVSTREPLPEDVILRRLEQIQVERLRGLSLGAHRQGKWHPEQEFFPTKFEVWNQEFIAVRKYAVGQGADIGCGVRSPNMGMYRIDLSPDVFPDLVADAIDLSAVQDETFNWVWASHQVEHNEDWRKALSEMIRICKTDGHVLLIIPDRRWTAGLDPTHKHEWTLAEFLSQEMPKGAAIVGYGVAGRNWSFWVAYKKGATQYQLCPECGSLFHWCRLNDDDYEQPAGKSDGG